MDDETNILTLLNEMILFLCVFLSLSELFRANLFILML